MCPGYFSRKINESPCLVSPVCPEEMDWSEVYPEMCSPPDECHDDEPVQRKAKVEFADIGCGYGGLLGKVISNLLAETNLLIPR